MQVFVLAEAKVCNLEDRSRALAWPCLLELDQRVLQLEITMCQSLIVDELYPWTCGLAGRKHWRQTQLPADGAGQVTWHGMLWMAGSV